MSAPSGVAWFTGLPSSGKSTLAEKVRERLRQAGIAVVLLDGDEVRATLRPAPGYDVDGRAAFYATLAGLAALLARQGLVVLVAATAHLRAFREQARALAPRFIEVWVDTPEAECRRRDTKGLYAHGDSVEAALPGAGLAYEPPPAPDVIARGGSSGAAAVDAVVEAIRARFGA